MSDKDLSQLREATQQGDRLDEEGDTASNLADDIYDQLQAMEDGDSNKVLSLWDQNLAALVGALEDNPEQMNRVGNEFQRRLDRAQEDVDRSELLRLALRFAFEETAPETVESLRDAVQKRALENI